MHNEWLDWVDYGISQTANIRKAPDSAWGR